MTRFLMNLDEAVDLVEFAFLHANPGDLFIQKAPASTIGDLAEAVQELFGRTGTRVIGTRHGEKLYETLMTREERLRAEDMGGVLPRLVRLPRPQLRPVRGRGQGRDPGGRALHEPQHAQARRRRGRSRRSRPPST